MKWLPDLQAEAAESVQQLQRVAEAAGIDPAVVPAAALEAAMGATNDSASVPDAMTNGSTHSSAKMQLSPAEAASRAHEAYGLKAGGYPEVAVNGKQRVTDSANSTLGGAAEVMGPKQGRSHPDVERISI